MLVQTISRNHSAGDDDLRHAHRLSERFARYFQAIVHVQWTLSAEGQRRIAACQLQGRSGFYRAAADTGDFRKSIDLAFDRVVKQRRRRKVISLRRARTSQKAN